MASLTSLAGSLQDQDSRFLSFSFWFGAQVSAVRGTIKPAVAALLETRFSEEFINPMKLSH